MKRKRGKTKFLEILNSKPKPFIRSLILIIFFLAIVVAGDVIVKEGAITIGDDFNASGILFVDSSGGKVGIGTTNPDYLLELGDDAGAASIGIHIDAGINAAMAIDRAEIYRHAAVQFQTAGVTDWYMGTHDYRDFGAGDDFYIGQNNTGNPEFIIKSDGKIGIGTSSPDVGLDVETVLGNTPAKFGSNLPVYIVHNSPTIGFNLYYNSGWKFGAGSTSKYGGTIGVNPNTGTMTFQTSDAGNTDGTATTSTRITIEQDGDVGIGDATPSEKLDVTGNVRADDFIEYSDVFKGDALNVIQGMKTTGTAVGDWEELDHTSLQHVDGLIKTYDENETIVYGRSINKMMDINTRAIEQLLDKIIFLENELCSKDNSYLWC